MIQPADWIIIHIFIGLLYITGVWPTSSSQQQYFRIPPQNLEAQEGSEVILSCEIEHLAGRVQWTKDGFALGYKAVIPGYPRYTMVGDSHNGVYNLRIRNVSLDDDAEFQCQVGPARVPVAHESIRSSANLTVLSPPSSIEIVGYGLNTKIEVKENQELKLECLVSRSKPAAKIIWYRGNSELKLDKREDKVTESDENSVPAHPSSLRGRRYDVSSRITLKPTAEDDYVNYTCEAQHETLPRDMPVRATIQLSVLYPPGPPYIEGYSSGETLRRGQNVELVCKSRGGNPPAQLVWYKNGEQIRAVYRNYGRISENVYGFTADMSDNNAIYTCEASSTVGPTQIKTEVNLTVYYAPIHVSIFGPADARVGDTVTLNCSTGASNPAAQIRWLVDGRQAHNISSKTEPASSNGWLTSSTLSIPVSQNKTDVVVICHGVNNQLAENVVATHTVNILHPPSQPVIHGYKRGVYVPAGTIQKLTCISSGGNPHATVTWYKNDKKVNSVTKTVDKNSVSAEISILINSTDNEAIYKCEAMNPALDIPLIETIKFNVYFPPDNVIIKKEPKELRAGTVAKLICDSSSSNPEAELSWWREGIPVTEGTSKSSKPGLHGGKVSTIDLILNISADMDGNVYICQATNTMLERSINSNIMLSVFYKPTFKELNETSFVGVENENLVVALEAFGHPSTISYTWIKDNSPLARNVHHFIDGPVLNITKLTRYDSGSYICEAVNSEGSSTVSFNISVEYSAAIAELSDVVLAGEDEEATLWCKIDAVPLSPEHITWRRAGYPMDKRTVTKYSYKNFTSYLTVQSITKDDMGLFYCVADNGIGNETSQPAYLVVKHKPDMDTSPVIAKSASNIGETGKLICRASGAPKVSFVWSRDSYTIPINTTSKYYINQRQVNVIQYESVLSIRGVELSDYGIYKCVARNSLGFANTSVRFSVPSAPDSPLNANVVNSTHDSITVTWTPGFDGGEPTRYTIRYCVSESSRQSYKYVEVGFENVYTLSGLQLATTYSVNVMAQNRIGKSSFMPNPLKATTSSEAPPSLPSLSGVSSNNTDDEKSTNSTSLVVAASVVILLILINIMLAVCCILRRSRRKNLTGLPAEALLVNAEYPLLFISCIAATAVLLLFVNICILTAFIYRRKKFAEGANDPSSNKTGTIEMYAPSSYNETVTGETLSSVSEKSETYSDAHQDYNDEKMKPNSNTYIIEQIDYPFQYPGYDTHPKENGSIGQHRNPYSCRNSSSGYHSGEPSCYGSASDARYVTYPPPMQFAQPSLPMPPAPCGRGGGMVPPPDVTVQTAQPTNPMSTFNYGNLESEGHLV